MLLSSFILVITIAFAKISLHHWDQMLYEDRIVHSEQSRYQRIVLTKHKNDIRLYLDGNLQFSSIDEYRYHESLVLVPITISPKPIKNVLLLGAGDGMAVRELLKHETIEAITLVDLDKSIITLAKNNPHLIALNQKSLDNPRVQIKTIDAFSFLSNNVHKFDLIISDLPDPNNNALARLYSKQFYTLIHKNLSPDGLFVTQATSPYFATKAFWSIVKTIGAGGFKYTYPYHASVPSFGEWGFVLASNYKISTQVTDIKIKTQFLNEENFSTLFVFDKDIITSDVQINHLDRPILLSYYLDGWRHYAH